MHEERIARLRAEKAIADKEVELAYAQFWELPPDWEERRRRVMERDSRRCRECGRKADVGEVAFHVHHVIQKSVREGSHSFENLLFLCEVCHSKITTPGHALIAESVRVRLETTWKRDLEVRSRRLGIMSCRDMLFLVPRTYVRRRLLSSISQIMPGEDVAILGSILCVKHFTPRRGRETVSVTVSDNTGWAEAIWSDRPNFEHVLLNSRQVLLLGKASFYNRLRFSNPEFRLVEPGDAVFRPDDAVAVVYRRFQGLRNGELRSFIRRVLDCYSVSLPETLSSQLLIKYGYPDMRHTVASMHFPASVGEGVKARQRVIFEVSLYSELLRNLSNRRCVHPRNDREVAGNTTADLQEHAGLLLRAHDEALSLIADDPQLRKPENRIFREALEQRYGGREDLLRVG